MTRMMDAGSGSDARSGALSFGEWLAVWTLRWIAQEPRARAPDGDDVPHGAYADLVRAEASFRSFLAGARQGGSRRAPHLARPVSPSLTRDERRLLRALAAVQAGDEVLMDNYLYKLALDPASRACLADGVRALAAALAAQGHRLPATMTQQPVPAPALPVARAHGRALHDLAVAWPSRPTRRCGP